MNEYQVNEYEIALLCGLAIAALWIVAYLLCWCGQRAWAWVDDAKAGKENLITEYFAKRAGYTPYRNDVFKYWNKEKTDPTDGWGLLIVPAFLCSMVPLLLVISFHLYPVVLALLTISLIAWVARFSRRQKKLFDKHITDKEAHK